jgi:hypothetical protein
VGLSLHRDHFYGGQTPGQRHREERTMSHDKIKAAARLRMSTTGEPYAAARRQAISEHHADRFTSPVSADDILAAAVTHRELGPDYSDAVVASFIDKVDRALAARVEARLAGLELSKPAQPARRGKRLRARRVARDALAALAGALIAVGAIGLYVLTDGQHSASHVSVAAAGTSASQAGNGVVCYVHPAMPGVTMLYPVSSELRSSLFVCSISSQASLHQ